MSDNEYTEIDFCTASNCIIDTHTSAPIYLINSLSSRGQHDGLPDPASTRARSYPAGCPLRGLWACYDQEILFQGGPGTSPHICYEAPAHLLGTIPNTGRICLGFVPKSYLDRWVCRFELGMVGMNSGTGWGRS